MSVFKPHTFSNGSLQAEGTIIQKAHSGSLRKKADKVSAPNVNSSIKRFKTSSKRALSHECRCPFKLRCFCSILDNCWYLAYDTNSSYHHKHHFQLHHSVTKKKIFSREMLQFVKECNSADVDNSSIRSLIENKFNLNVTNDQIRKLRDQHMESLLDGASRSPYGSSAQKLIAFFTSLSDVSFIYMMHHPNSGFVTCVKKKGKETSENSAVDVGISNAEMNAWRKELLVVQGDDDQTKILVCLCWCLDSELSEYGLFPEFLAVDVTFGTNRNSRNVAKVVGVDSSNQICTFASCFMGSKQRKGYRWLFEVALPSLLGNENAKKTSVVAMDNEEALNQAWITTDVWKNSNLRLDYYHIFLKPWMLNIPKISSSSVSGVMDCVYKWIHSFFDNCESNKEYNISKNMLQAYIKEQSRVIGTKMTEILNDILDTLFAKECFISHYTFMGLTYFNFKGSSIVEAENAAHKKSSVGNATLAKCAQKQINLSENRQQRHLM